MVLIWVVDEIINDKIVFSVVSAVRRTDPLISNTWYNASSLFNEPVDTSACPTRIWRTTHMCPFFEQTEQLNEGRGSQGSVLQCCRMIRPNI